MDAAIGALLQQQSGGSRGGGVFAAAQPEIRGSKRRGDPDDSTRLQFQQADSRGAKRIEDNLDDSERFRHLAVVEAHASPMQRPEHVSKGELEWRNSGSGVFARTFLGASRRRTTPKGWPGQKDVHRRVVRSLSTGKVIDDCMFEIIFDDAPNRYLGHPDDLRVELPSWGNPKMFREENAEIS